MLDELSGFPFTNPAFEVPHAARLWNYWLGGKDNFEADWHAGDLVVQFVPGIVDAARHSRAFLNRAVHHLATREGIGQFLDIGVGLPAVDNTHEVAQRIIPDARVVYVDNDPLVLAHAAVKLTSDRGAVDIVNADARDTGTVLDEAARTLDLTRPVGLLMLGVLSHIPDDHKAKAVVAELVAGLAPGSHLVIAHPTAELHGELLRDTMRLLTELGSTPTVTRTPAQIAGFFTGLHLLHPGIVPCSHWRPDPSPWDAPPVLQYCGVARIPGPEPSGRGTTAARPRVIYQPAHR
ncbi:SAM-dependent methyltransferase [Actinomadura sp. WAC 06369]|uniref:SAM-dependent methyltransferase n=1 Tax=Actinomadura sp. WAC 06369 TaxID=2203193 RepID=UPI000F76D487|nr:SAM-dependent methyltransferase [Actinomadura sp. WAC 06369]RSN53243.1 hypothetical protein DMH08_27790 [Actinomadura sp. WAC 06369]